MTNKKTITIYALKGPITSVINVKLKLEGKKEIDYNKFFMQYCGNEKQIKTAQLGGSEIIRSGGSTPPFATTRNITGS